MELQRRYIRRNCRRAVALEIVTDDRPTLLSYDGTEHTQQVIGAENDPRRSPAGKTR